MKTFSHSKKPRFLVDRLTQFLCLAGLLSCLTAHSAEKAQLAVKDQKLFVKFSLFHDKGVHKTTNYRISVLVPVNTEVTFIRSDKRDIEVKLPDGTLLTLANVQDFSGENVVGIFNRTFSTTPVDLDRFTEAERKAIKAGIVEPGMSKEAVIVALGYPPKHQTPSLEQDSWRYWRNKFNTFLVNFNNGKVASIKD